MSRPKVGGIGAVVLVSFILTTISVFSKGWYYISVTVLGIKSSAGGGIVPFNSNEAGWFAASSWMMFISFGLFFPLFLVYLHAGWKVHHHGCCHEIRHNFNGIAAVSGLIALLEAIAFTLMAINVPQSAGVSGYGKASQSLGYSAYLALVSAIFMIINMALAGHVSRHHCH